MLASSDYVSPKRMPNYEPPEKKVQINMRIPRSLKTRLDGLVEVWKRIAKANGDEPEDVDLTHVCTVLLRNGADASWGELGGYPSTPEGMEALLKRASLKTSK